MAADQDGDQKEPASEVPNPGAVRTIMAVLGGLVSWCLVGVACGMVFVWLKPPSGVAGSVAGVSISFLAASGAGYCMGRIARRRSWLPVTVFAVILALAYGALLIYMSSLSGLVSATLTAGMVAGLIGLPVVALCWARIGEAVSRRAVRQERGKLVKLGAISLGAILVVSLIAWGASRMLSAPTNEMKELERRLDELRASGAPMSLAEAAPAPVPDEENGALLYMQAFDELGKFEDRKALCDDEPAEPGSDRPEAATDDLLRFFAESQSVYDLLRAAAERPRCRFPVNWEDGFAYSTEHCFELRHCARYLRTRAITMARAGRTDEAVATLTLLFDVAGSVRDEPMTTSWLVSNALHRIALGTLQQTAAMCELQAADLEALGRRAPWPDAGQALARALIGERAMGIRLFQLAREGEFDPWEMLCADGTCSSTEGLYATPLGARILAGDEHFYLDAMGRIIDMAPLPYQEVRQRIREWEADAESPPVGAIISVSILETTRYITECATLEADVAVSLTGLRLLAYRAETGRYPGDLAELERADGQPLPLDPFTGAPLVYEPREDGFLLYSYGPDEEDDAGEDDDVAWEMVRR